MTLQTQDVPFGTVPFFSQGTGKTGQSPTFYRQALSSSFAVLGG